MIVVTTPPLAAQAVAARAADMARRGFLRVIGVIENMSGFTCEHGDHYALFGEGGGRRLAEELGVPLLAEIPLNQAVSAGGDEGAPVALGEGPLAEIFESVAKALIESEDAVSGCSARLLRALDEAVSEA
jgi:ATP-binding protein involved in chromosome partitioning